MNRFHVDMGENYIDIQKYVFESTVVADHNIIGVKCLYMWQNIFIYKLMLPVPLWRLQHSK
jgi:hypothetical protein